ncbi:MAG: hypothetical protein AAB531_03515 [Patescibacteria group bacterium]
MVEEALRRVGNTERQEDQPVRFTIEGGRPLEGSVTLPGAKNSSLQAIAAATLTDNRVLLDNFPQIGDTDMNLSILRKLGAKVEKPASETVSISTNGISEHRIDRADSMRTTGSRYFIPTMVRRKGKIIAGPHGGDQLGAPERFQFREDALRIYESIGIGSRPTIDSHGRPAHEFFALQDQPTELRLEERFFGPTVMALLSFAVSDREFRIINPNVEPEVKDTIAMLNDMGAEIEHVGEGFENGEDFIHIAGKKYLHGTRTRIKSDPNAMVSYAVMALITSGDVEIKGIDHTDKTEAFVEILMAMGVDFYFGGGILHILPSQNPLKPVDLKTDIWPGQGWAQCHTDWQQLLTPLLATLHGTSYVDENVYPERFGNVDALGKQGARLTQLVAPNREQITRPAFKSDEVKPHTLRIEGPTKFHPVDFLNLPKDVRGATGVLVAALSAEGRTTLVGAEQILRGLENVDKNLRSLGAKITRS